MRASTATSGAAAAAASSILRSLEKTITTTGASHLEPAFRILPPSLLSLAHQSTRSLSTSLPSTLAHQEYLNTNLAKSNTKITTLPQLNTAMQMAYTSRHYDQVLSLYTAGDAYIIKPASRTDPRTAAMTYDCALKACAAAAEARQAQRILSTMWKRGVPVGRVAQGSVLKALCAAGHRPAAFQHLKGIPAARVTTMHCNTVLSACAAAHDVAIGLKVWDFMKRRAVQLDDVSYCEVLRVFGAAGNFQNIISLWEDEINPALSTNNSAIESRVMIASAYAGALAASGQLSLAMAQCENIMDSLSHVLPQELHLAIELEAERNDDHNVDKNLNSNSSGGSGGRQTAAPLDHLRSACNAVLHAAVASHQWTYLRKMVALMTSRGLPPDVITYNALLKAAVKRGEGPQPIHEGIFEMKALGLQPTSATYTLLIEAYAGEGDVEGAHTIFNSMLHTKNEPTVDKRPGGGVAADAGAWNAVLRAHAGIGDVFGLGQTFQLMVDQGEIVPDESTYITCFEGIATALRKHTSMLDTGAIFSEQAASATDAAPTNDGAAAASSNINNINNATTEAKKVAMSVLHHVEQHMKKTIKPSKSSLAMRAALVKADGALHHTAIVWSLLADEYIYNIYSTNNQSKTATKVSRHSGGSSGSGINTNTTETDRTSVLTTTAAVHPLPPKSHHSSLLPTETQRSEIENELLEALTTTTTTALSKNTKNENKNNINSNLTLNVVPPRVLNAGIPSLIRAGRTDLVIQLVHHLSRLNSCPDADTYATLIAACASTGASAATTSHHHVGLRPAFARRLLTQMQQQYALMKEDPLLKPCARVYTALLRVECARAGVNAALDVLEEMKDNAVQPDSHTWMVLRGCALGHGRPDIAEQASYEIRLLKNGSSSAKLSRSSEGGADVAEGATEEEEGEGRVVAAVETSQSEERHWKGYYATDEEDEW